jgi:gliding motility-associated-like protein
MKWLLLFLLFVTPFIADAQCGPCFRYHEAVTNGNFSSGNSGFTTTLAQGIGFFCPLCPEGTFAVGFNAWIYHNDFIGFDHTNPGNGLFFIANSAPSSGTPVWCQTMDVEPFTDYTVEFWGRDVANNPDPHPLAELRWSFNGVPFGDTLICFGGWQLSQDVWNSGPLTSVEACIVNWQEDMGGNDFGLDDLSIHACIPIVLSAAAEAGPDSVEVCSNTPVQLGTASVAGYTYQWSHPELLSNTSFSAPVLSVENTSADTAWYSLTVSSDSAAVGCITTDTVHVGVLPAPLLVLQSGEVVCPGDSLWLHASGGFDAYHWSTGSSTEGTYVYTGGVYTVEVQKGTCLYEASTEVMQPVLPDVSGLPETVSFCETDSVLLTVALPVWWNDTLWADQFWLYTAGVYTASAEVSGCMAEASVTAQVDNIPAVELLPYGTWCEGTTATLEATMAGVWNTGDTGFSTTIDAAGTYSISVLNGMCNRTVSVDIPLLGLPDIALPTDTLICEGEPTRMLAGNESGVNYLWNTGDSTAYLEVSEAAIFTVNATNACGTVVHTLAVDTWPCMWNVYAPTAVSPNGDGINDQWKVEAWNVQNVRIRVYDKLGNLVFATNRLDEEWVPTSGGNEAFVYRIEAVDQDGREFALHGHILSLP